MSIYNLCQQLKFYTEWLQTVSVTIYKSINLPIIKILIMFVAATQQKRHN